MTDPRTPEAARGDLNDAIADIAYEAGYQGFRTEDSRRTSALLIEWAEEFDALHQHTDWAEVDYLDLIEVFTERKLDEYADENIGNTRRNND